MRARRALRERARAARAARRVRAAPASVRLAASGGAGSGAAGGVTGTGGSLPDAATDAMPMDATNDATSAPQCLGPNDPCGDDGGGICCEAYVCRYGKCCVPTGICPTASRAPIAVQVAVS